jgi:hypothetical protein
LRLSGLSRGNRRKNLLKALRKCHTPLNIQAIQLLIPEAITDSSERDSEFGAGLLGTGQFRGLS